MKVGYVRVSTIEQNPERQIAELHKMEVEKLFIDKCSGKDANRPQLKELLSYVREGDEVYICSLDRLARNMAELSRILNDLHARGVLVFFIKENLKIEPLKASSAISQLMFNIMGSFAEFERTLIRERQAEGIAIAKSKGIYRGGTKKLTVEQVADLKSQAGNGVPKIKIAKTFGITRETVYQYLRRRDFRLQNDLHS